MTIINAFITPERAIVVSDTEVLAEECDSLATGQTTKALALPHMPAIVAARGRAIATVQLVAAGLYVSDFDTLDDHMEGLAGALLGNIGKIPEAAGVPDLHRAELIAVGWSPRERRIRAFHMVQETEGAGFRRSPEPEWHVSPWPEAWGTTPPPVPNDRSEWIALARRQAKALKDLGSAGGGDLVVATLDPDGVIYEIERDFMARADGEPTPGFADAVRAVAGRPRTFGRGL